MRRRPRVVDGVRGSAARGARRTLLAHARGRRQSHREMRRGQGARRRDRAAPPSIHLHRRRRRRQHAGRPRRSERQRRSVESAHFGARARLAGTRPARRDGTGRRLRERHRHAVGGSRDHGRSSAHGARHDRALRSSSDACSSSGAFATDSANFRATCTSSRTVANTSVSAVTPGVAPLPTPRLHRRDGRLARPVVGVTRRGSRRASDARRLLHWARCVLACAFGEYAARR